MSGYDGTGERDAVAPGWYYDAGTGSQRWWDGQAWTERRQPAADGAASTAPYASQPHGQQPYPQQPYAPARPVLTNHPATAGLVLGIVAMVVNVLTIPSIVGIVLSSAGLRRANQLAAHGYAAVGRAKAGWGLALSVLAFLFSASSKFFLF
ncbi:DUF2510 domain-containing protein [Cellulomonas triticagri]|uniref:DUF2510 domain-containing protein n=1 Tax=Cellulomonas triticagri TaxID=2483352 RepID=A0A3M2JUA2_9CELL|nr:DUF2510 domain-containing protein [Cellulomonas triticagri]RMI13738.1 DUF2510 domain-containing protein [Cellulomonas triticagri]